MKRKTLQHQLSFEMRKERAMQNYRSKQAKVTEMTDPYSLEFMRGEDDARHGRDAAPDCTDWDTWMAYIEGYARDPSLLPWENA